MLISPTTQPDPNTAPTAHVTPHKPRRSGFKAAALSGILSGALVLTGCGQQSDSNTSTDETQTVNQPASDISKPAIQSDSAAARIEQFQPRYVAQMQALQRRLQAEYESLQAADMPEAATASLLTNPKADEGANADSNSVAVDPAAPSLPENPSVSNTENRNLASDDSDSSASDINTSTEVGERDLEVLKRISLEPRPPEILTEAQIIARYQQATQALYAPDDTPLSSAEMNTLLNIAALLPQLFEHTEIADRVVVKSPALARLIVQHQVWAQIEAQQALDMQAMKQAQQQEFEALMTKFNDTIKDYDEQIAKYEATLKEFE